MRHLAVLNQNFEQSNHRPPTVRNPTPRPATDNRLKQASGPQLCFPSPVMF